VIQSAKFIAKALKNLKHQVEARKTSKLQRGLGIFQATLYLETNEKIK